MAAYLSALFKGQALDVYDRLSNEDEASNDKLEEAVLRNFDMTERFVRNFVKVGRRSQRLLFSLIVDLIVI